MTNDEDFKGVSTLISRNINIFDKRTSVRLEPEMWRALHDIARNEDCSIHDICTLVYMRKNPKTSLTAAIRVFLMLYYRAATTEEGHTRAGHGNFRQMLRRARMQADLWLKKPKHQHKFRRNPGAYSIECAHGV